MLTDGLGTLVKDIKKEIIYYLHPELYDFLGIFFVPFCKIILLFPTTLIISLHTCPYLLYIFFFDQQ